MKRGMDMKQKEEDLLKIFAASIRGLFIKNALDYDKLQEIRLRVMSPLLLQYENQEYYMDREGRLKKEPGNAYIDNFSESQ